MRVLFYCQHVLGMGHMFRSLEIARALSGHNVLFVTGGPEVSLEIPEHVRHERLPGLRMDAAFSALLPTPETHGLTIEEIKTARKTRLLELMRSFRPQVFLVELYPFGRRAFGFELKPALEWAARNRCRRVCSLRDILVEKKDQDAYEQRVLKLLHAHFDTLLVHADPDMCDLEQTFSRFADIKIAATYTGYVAAAPDPGKVAALRDELRLSPGTSLIVASAGSGSVGYELLSGAIEASALLAPHMNHRLCVFSGPLLDDDAYSALERRARTMPQVRLRRFSARFTTWLGAADLSLSMGGYNTVMSLVAAGTYGLVSPFAQNREQRMRAELLQARGALSLLEPHELAPEALASRMRQALQASSPIPDVNVQGAANTARCLEALHAPAQRRGSVQRAVCRPWTNGGQESWDDFFQKLRDIARGGETSFFFRADDVAVPGEKCAGMLGLFLRHNVPLWPALVPAWLHEEHWRVLRAQSRDSGLFVWHQHGWLHRNHQVWGKKSEFGSDRALAHKRSDLLKGRERLDTLLRNRFTPIFTPPWNRMDAGTMRIISDLGYGALSGDHKLARLAATLPPNHGALPVHSIQVDLHTRRETDDQTALDGLLREFAAGVAAGCVGVMLHHQRMNGQSFAFLDRLLATVPHLGWQPVKVFH